MKTCWLVSIAFLPSVYPLEFASSLIHMVKFLCEATSIDTLEFTKPNPNLSCQNIKLSFISLDKFNTKQWVDDLPKVPLNYSIYFLFVSLCITFL